MARRPRRGALGLRGRIVGAVFVTTVATLGIAALALLGPLEHSLRQEARKTLQQDLRRANAESRFRGLDLTYVLDAANGLATDPGHTAGAEQKERLATQQRSLGERLGATVVLWGYPNANWR